MTLELREYERKSYIRRVVVAWVTIVCIAASCLVIIPKQAHASSLAEYLTEGEVAEDFVDIVNQLTNGAFINDVISDFYQGTIGSDSVVSSIIGDVQAEKETFMKGLASALKAIAFLIIVYHMLLTLTKELERGQMTTESWLRVLLAFVLPCVLIIEYDVIINVIAKIGQWMYETLGDIKIDKVTVDGKSFSSYARPTCKKLRQIPSYLGKLVKYLMCWVKGLLLTLIYGIVNIIIIIIILSGIMSNFVELVIRHFFVPLAIANISHEGVRSAGVRYIKKYLGCYIKIGCIMVTVAGVFYVYRSVTNINAMKASSSIFSDLYKVLFFFLLIPTMKQALKMTTEIVGDALGV